MPVVGNCNDDGVYLFVVEQLFVSSRSAHRFSDNFPCQLVTPIVKIAGGRALHSGELNGSGQQSRSLHADPHNSKANLVTGGMQSRQSDQRFGLK